MFKLNYVYKKDSNQEFQRLEKNFYANRLMMRVAPYAACPASAPWQIGACPLHAVR